MACGTFLLIKTDLPYTLLHPNTHPNGELSHKPNQGVQLSRPALVTCVLQEILQRTDSPVFNITVKIIVLPKLCYNYYKLIL